MGQSERRWKECLFRHHAHDWVLLIALAIFELLLLKVIPPFRRYLNEYMINDLKFPVKSFTVPIFALVLIAFGIPIVTILVYYLFRRDKNDLHHGIRCLLFTLIITAVITDSFKNATGRPRPDFFWRCFPDGVARFVKETGDVDCTGKIGEVHQGYKSFPSGHSSWAFAGMVFLAWYLAARIRFSSRRAHMIKFAIVSIPIIIATLVAVSILNDYWHHWSDVVAGAALGIIVGTLCYRHHFPTHNFHTEMHNAITQPTNDIENGNASELELHPEQRK